MQFCTLPFGITMRKLLFVLLLAAPAFTPAQNLVINGSLENTAGCPIDSPNFNDYVAPWNFFFGQVDYYHPCKFPGSDSATNNALPFDGKGFAGVRAFGDTGAGDYLRDYLHGELRQPLDSGKFYRITYYVKPVQRDNGYGLGVANLNLLFTDSVVDTIPEGNVLPYQPQVTNNKVITNTSYWTPICDIYKATGNEKHLTIGNFSTDAETEILPLEDAVTPLKSYYLIDFVQVVENDLPQLPEDTVICEDGRIDLVINRPGVSVTWSDESTDKRFTVTEPGTYWADIQNQYCSYRDSITIEPVYCVTCEVYTPNAFTPNGDGKNDEFQVFPNCGPEGELIDFNISIFDRWGQKVFQSDDYRVSWKGKDAPTGDTYTYVIEYTYSQEQGTRSNQKTGVVTVVR